MVEDQDIQRLVSGKTILITGGTGFLGRHLVKTLLAYNPQSIRVYSRDEVKHHKVQEDFGYNKKIRNLIGDVRDKERLCRAVEGCDIVIHAAALKRLDILEYNVSEAIKTDIIGTMNVVDACLDANVDKAVLISSDKACSPINTYGACKFVSERLFTESNFSKGSHCTSFSCVRYGNVLESTGSVIPFFMEKILSKQKVPVTDTRMTRFIITPKGAVDLVMNCLVNGVGGEVFVPSLPAFRIMDLIDVLVDKQGIPAETEIVGIRPGEKIHECMINSSEVPRTWFYDGAYIITSAISDFVRNTTVTKYTLGGRLLKDGAFPEPGYTSDISVFQKEDLKKFFKGIGLL